MGSLTLCTLAAGACGAAARSRVGYPARLRRAYAPGSYKCGLGTDLHKRAPLERSEGGKDRGSERAKVLEPIRPGNDEYHGHSCRQKILLECEILVNREEGVKPICSNQAE